MDGGSVRRAIELALLASRTGEFTPPRSATDGAEREAPGRGAAGLRGEEAIVARQQLLYRCLRRNYAQDLAQDREIGMIDE